jgi:dTDP-4-dehydrorhamnose 3,5-epimerase
MIFESTAVSGVVLITPKRMPDQRGFFSVTWAQDEFEAHGLETRVFQRNLAFNHEARTLRGMHFQKDQHAEVKIISCQAGAVYDVALDLRPESPTYRRWTGVELRPETGQLLYVPRGCAHGYLTLEPRSIVEYLISDEYAPHSAGGVRWDDRAFAIEWPAEPLVMNERDRTWPDFAAVQSVRS